MEGYLQRALQPTKKINCENSWLSHELETGCNLDGRATITPTSDYSVETCVDTQVDEDGAFLLYGCGTAETKHAWNCLTQSRYGYCDGWGTLIQDASTGVFKYDTQISAMIGDRVNKPQQGSEIDWRYVYTPYQERLPYCPLKHFFNNDGSEVNSFIPTKCALCTAVCADGDLAIEKISVGDALCGEGNLGQCKAKAQDFEQCPGFGLVDTQQRCTAGCDIGYYEKKVSYPEYGADFPTSQFERDGESKCVPCESCRF